MAGNSKWILLYEPRERFLVAKWAVSENRSVDGVSDVYDWKADTEAGKISLIDSEDSDEREYVWVDGVGYTWLTLRLVTSST